MKRNHNAASICISHTLRRDSNVYGDIELNDVGESSLEKLGWFRFHNDQWNIRRGAIKLRHAHNVYFTNCLEQIYYSAIDANYVVFNSSNEQTLNFDMGRLVSSDPWIETATYADRVVIVKHAEGLHVTMHVITETRPKVVRHSSEFIDFMGSIHLDQHSNRYLKCHLPARGTILGGIYTNETKSEIQERLYVPLATTKVANFTTRISLPTSVNRTQYVCFHPKGDPDGEICHCFYAINLKKVSTRNDDDFHEGKGSCPECNQRSADVLQWIFDSIALEFNESFQVLKMAFLIGCIIVVTIAFCLIVYFISKEH
ncbi:hypothetical protein COOONC_11472 [Cooperia oncophora]